MHGADGRTGADEAVGADGRMGAEKTDGRTGRRGADGRSGGRADWAVGASRARTGGRADEGVGLGLKGTIPPPHFTLGRPICLPR